VSRVERLRWLAPMFLIASVRRDWPLAALALLSLAPGVAALVAWLQVAWRIRQLGALPVQFGWILPPALLSAITPAGVLVGAGLVTLLIGCLGLSNAYLASVERRLGDLALLLSLGLSRLELISLLLLEAMGLAGIGAAFGLLLGLGLSVVSWLPARDYLGLPPGFQLAAAPFVLGALAGLLATLLFVGVTGVNTGLRPLSLLNYQSGVLAQTGARLRSQPAPRSRPARDGSVGARRDWENWRFSTLGIAFTTLMTALLGVLAVGWRAGLALTLIALTLALLLNAGSWLLTRSYRRLPIPDSAPLWSLAVQHLARHRRQTAGMTLAMTAGALGVGVAALGWVGDSVRAAFPLWVAGMLLLACASLVMTTSALAALERRQELGLLAALGARRGRIYRLILLENAIISLAGGALGAALALVIWVLVGSQSAAVGWGTAVVIAVLDVLAALATAWIGAAPVLWLVSRQPPGVSLRDRPWLTR
jgi:predicted lysophospholipase L1 biosynthesis ABC-type transport system permease subunit